MGVEQRHAMAECDVLNNAVSKCRCFTHATLAQQIPVSAASTRGQSKGLERAGMVGAIDLTLP